ncbi:MAG: hypothetical protein JRF07_04580 [Deltaproteobacteria bacterium]|nr:hypothetical protein [Deltaproteobacteria bacterium]MBW2478077.1 hypothetical protein [Deltaproteobacteria bacterium]
MTADYKDRFTEAEKELQEKSAFLCESCNATYTKKHAKDQGMTCCGRTMKELLEEGFGP